MYDESGIFILSLDHELYWGLRDKRPVVQSGEGIRDEERVIEDLLRLFAKYQVHCTWATVGFLFYPDADQLRRNLPRTLPSYWNPALSPYPYLANHEELEPPYHFCPDLIERIARQEGQEIGSHTFSHYYCLEPGQTREQFADDLDAAVTAARAKGHSLRSLAFPRNQENADYLPLLEEKGVLCYRGQQKGWMHQIHGGSGKRTLDRAFRLLDTYVNLSGLNTYPLEPCLRRRPYNFPASRFLRPYMESLAAFEGLRLRRITRSMRDAARHCRVFHLWWHPHNFRAHAERNFAFLERILDCYGSLRATYGMRSLNMGELALLGEANHGK
jgi:peptidoglycan/xylan/chitin deacetylase (PgdA/CDA1 family)